MTASKDDILLHYYANELNYLRQEGALFARRYPKIASRLELGETECPDPHVERMLEAFAFLTGRIQYNIDSEFPLFTSALLENLYPHYLQPVPAMSIAQFQVDPEQGQFTGGHLIDKHTALITNTPEGRQCRFRTCSPVRLWPLQVDEAVFELPQQHEFLDAMPNVSGVLRLRLRSLNTDLKPLQLDSLRFFLNAPWITTAPLYELLNLNVLRIALLPPEGKKPVLLSAQHLQAQGFDDDLLLYPSHAHPAYRLLQEYFAFPEKFLFFELSGLEKLNPAEGQESFDMLFLLDSAPRKNLRIAPDIFRLGCAPITNLFTTVSEPVRIHQRQTEYRLVADRRWENSTEIHSIRKVTASMDAREDSSRVHPYFSFRHDMALPEPRLFWSARRVPTVRPGMEGTDTLLTFMDLDFNPRVPQQSTLFAHVYCTNRHLARHVPEGGVLQIEQAAPLHRIVCLKQPTEQLDSPLGGATIWRVISHLSLNYLSLTDDKAGLEALQEILRLYNFRQQKSVQRQINGIVGLAARRTNLRLGDEAWRGFVRGFEIEMEVEPDLYTGSSALLLSAVLERFLAMYVSVNSFTQLNVSRRGSEGIWKSWAARAGEKTLL